MGQSVGIKVDPKKEIPIHRQIFDEIVARIGNGTFPPGFKLPPTRTLARELGAHRNTVARAYEDLESAGFVSAGVGRGTFVEAASKPSASKVATPKTSNAMPWSALVARAARPEVLGRAERYARVEKKDVINLARMQPSADLLPDDLVRRCVTRVLAEQGTKAMTYAPPEGIPRLRESIAGELAARGVPCVADDVLVTTGSQQGLDLVARALVNPGDALLVEATTYSGAIDLFTLAGARLVGIASDKDGPDRAALDGSIGPDVKALYVMPNGHNPTGRTMTEERRRALVAWSRAARIPIIEDDFAAGLSLDEGNDPPYLRALDGDVIHLSTFSKRLIPALRLGYVVAPAPVRATLRSMKRVVDLGTSAILQHALAEFIERGYLRAHMTRITAEYRTRRDALVHALEKGMPDGVKWVVPSHGIVLWLELPRTLDPDAVYAEAHARGVLVSPSPMWSVDPHAPPGIRLAFCAEPEGRLVEGVKRLGKAMKTLLARAPRRGAHGPNETVLEAV